MNTKHDDPKVQALIDKYLPQDWELCLFDGIGNPSADNEKKQLNLPSANSIFLPEPKGDKLIGYESPTFVVACHELGHVNMGHKIGMYRVDKIVKKEVEAWQWALERGLLDEYGEDKLVYMAMALNSYRRGLAANMPEVDLLKVFMTPGEEKGQMYFFFNKDRFTPVELDKEEYQAKFQ